MLFVLKNGNIFAKFLLIVHTLCICSPIASSRIALWPSFFFSGIMSKYCIVNFISLSSLLLRIVLCCMLVTCPFRFQMGGNIAFKRVVCVVWD
uniref:Uncharacterized protein n=1 Tax=Anopheles darlingi TaxID=43151 RepID=A0A2M4DFP5_ANODA